MRFSVEKADQLKLWENTSDDASICAAHRAMLDYTKKLKSYQMKQLEKKRPLEVMQQEPLENTELPKKKPTRIKIQNSEDLGLNRLGDQFDNQDKWKDFVTYITNNRPYSFWNHQAEACKRIGSAFLDNNYQPLSGYVQMATGTGKTLIIEFLVRALIT